MKKIALSLCFSAQVKTFESYASWGFAVTLPCR